MNPDNDGVADMLDGQLRIALTVAVQMGERVARLREELARTRRAQTQEANRELQARFDVQRVAARAEVAPVYEAHWWDTASAEQIANVYETAVAWRGIDTEADHAGERIAQEVRSRYGVDVHSLDANSMAVREAITMAEHERTKAAIQRGESAVDVVEADAFIAAADRLDRAAAEREQVAAENERLARDVEDGTVLIGNDPRGEAERILGKVDANLVAGSGLRMDAASGRASAEESFDSPSRRQSFTASLEGKVARDVPRRTDYRDG
jgi:uncharacterized protein YajQ (UPF0234 family)